MVIRKRDQLQEKINKLFWDPLERARPGNLERIALYECRIAKLFTWLCRLNEIEERKNGNKN